MPKSGQHIALVQKKHCAGRRPEARGRWVCGGGGGSGGIGMGAV